MVRGQLRRASDMEYSNTRDYMINADVESEIQSSQLMSVWYVSAVESAVRFQVNLAA